MGYDVMNVNAGTSGSFSSVYTDRLSDNPGKFSGIEKSFLETDMGKAFSESGGNVLNYLRAREEYVFLNVLRYLTRTKTAPEGDDRFAAEANGTAYTLSNSEALRVRRAHQGDYMPLYKPFGLGGLKTCIYDLYETLPDSARKTYMQHRWNSPFVEHPDAYEEGKSPLLNFEQTMPNSDGVHYAKYIDYVISRLVKMYEKSYDSMCLKNDIDYALVYTDPFLSDASLILDAIERDEGHLVTTVYAKQRDGVIDFYITPDSSGDPVFTYTWGKQGTGYFTYAASDGQTRRYGPSYGSEGKVVDGGLSNVLYSEPSYTMDLDQEVYYGATGVGKADSEGEKQGLLSVMGSFISDADARVFERTFNPDAEYTKAMAQTLFDTMSWLYSEGQPFSIRAGSKANSSTVELLLTEMPGNQRIVFTPGDNNSLNIRLESSMYNYEIHENHGISDVDATKLLFRYIRGELAGRTSSRFKSSGKVVSRMKNELNMAYSEVEVKGGDLVSAGLVAEDEIMPDTDVLNIRVYSNRPHFASRFCYDGYTNGSGVYIEPEGAYRIQMYVVSAMQNFIETMKFDEIREEVARIASSSESTEEDFESVTKLLSNDPNVSDMQKKYILDLIDIHGYVAKAGMIEESDPVRPVTVEEFVENLRSVENFASEESYRLSTDQFVDALVETICREQIGEIYDISNIDRDMLMAAWSADEASSPTMSDLVDEYGEYVPASRVRDIHPEMFKFNEDIAEGEEIDMSARANCNCRFYPSRFNAVGVLTYGHGNTNGINRTSLQAALMQMKYPSEKVFGDAEFSATTLQKSLLHFDEESRVDYETCTNEYEKHAMEVCRDALIANGAVNDVAHPIRVAVDKQGIISWKAYRNIMTGGTPGFQECSGEIGQIPIRDSDARPGEGFDSIYRTRFGTGENYIFAPGYAGWFTTEGIDDETATEENGFHMRERLRVRGFDDIFDSRIRQVVSRQMTQPYVVDKVSTGVKNEKGKLATASVPRNPVCLDATALNDTYTKDTYGLRLDYDFFDKNRLDIATDGNEHTKAFIDTITSKVRFPTSMRDTNTTSAARRYEKWKKFGGDDNFSPAERLTFKLSGFQSMRIPKHDIFGGVFDLEMIGSDSNQGLSMYLVEGARVENGRVIAPPYDPETDKVPRCSFANMDEFRYIDNDMAGRTRMVSNQLVGAKRIMKDVATCYSTFYGWTFDDAYVVSKEFAESASVLNEEGESRPLVKGDKLSDFGGNKGVISLIVDRTWTDEDIERLAGGDEYKKEMYVKARDFFRSNPQLEVVGSPFGPMSRDNASVIMKGLEAHEKGGLDPLYHPDGHVDNSLARTDFIIPHQTVDEKTTTYEGQNEGRKISSQLVWAMSAKGASGLIASLFKNNASAWSDLREYMITTGLDLSEDGTIITKGYTPYKVPASDAVYETNPELVDEERTSFMPYQAELDDNGKPVVIKSTGKNQILTDFRQEISVSGGFLLLPTDFGTLPPAAQARAEAMGLNIDFALPSYYGDTAGSADSRKALEKITYEDGKEYYRIPILPPHLRRDSKNLDGSYTTHDFTLQYEKIYESIIQWYNLGANVLHDHTELNDEKFSRDIEDMRRATTYLTSNFDQVQSTIITQILNGKGTGKYSYFRDELQGIRWPNSATSVFMPDPTLPIGEVAMDREIMKSLGVRDGESILVWRDPVLRDGALRCVTARFDPSVHGVSMNPFCDYSMDGDFDGDTLGMIKIPEEAKEEAVRLFGYGDNLLEVGAEPKVVDGKENSPLYFNFSMDIKTAEALNPSLATLRENIEQEANDCARAMKEDGADRKVIRKKQDELVERLTDYSRKVYETAGDYMHTIDFTSKETVFDSFRRMALDGSKGSASKLIDLLQYANWSVSDADAKVTFKDMLSLKDMNPDRFDEWFATFRPEVKVESEPMVSHEETERVHEASSIKTDDTGSAGTKSQAVMAALREVCPASALNVTYNVTQALLQIKKDPVMAHRMDGLVCTDMATLFSGKKPRCFYDDEKAKLDEIKTSTEFADVFYHLITDKDKMALSVSRKEVENVARGLCMEKQFYAPDAYREKFGTVLDYLSYGSDGKSVRCFDILQTLDGKNFHKTVDGRPAQMASAFVPEKIGVSRDVTSDYAEDLREQFAGKLGIQTERLNRAANEIKRIRELKEELETKSEAYISGMESGEVSPARLREMRADIDLKQENLDKLVESQYRKADTRAFTDNATDPSPN